MELHWTATGKRVFNILINGTTVLSNFDIYAAAGGNYKAVLREFTAIANSSGQIAIKFNTVTDNATIEGIEIIKKWVFGRRKMPPSCVRGHSALPCTQERHAQYHGGFGWPYEPCEMMLWRCQTPPPRGLGHAAHMTTVFAHRWSGPAPNACPSCPKNSPTSRREVTSGRKENIRATIASLRGV